LVRLVRQARSGLFFLITSAILLTSPVSEGAQQKPASPDADAIISHLNQVITWYRRVVALNAGAGEPGDVLYLDNAHKLATQAVQFAFQSATAQAALLNSHNNQGQAQPPSSEATGSAQEQNIANAVTAVNNQITQTQSQLDDLEQQLAHAKVQQRQQLLSQRDALKGQLELYKAAQDALHRIAAVGNLGDNTSGGLLSQINQLKQSVPEVFGSELTQKGNSPANAAAAAKSSKTPTAGLISQASGLFEQLGDIRALDQAMSETLRVRAAAQRLEAPLRASLHDLMQQGRELINQPPATTGQVGATHQNFAALTEEFKQQADASVPLSQEMVVLDQCHSELMEWRNSIALEYGRALRGLLLRVLAVLVALAFVLLLSSLWRRATYRYIRDVRRRRQLTLVRRFVVGFLMAMVIVVGFISEFTSLATFAGLITAGIAVALQTVILSIAAYFFLVGRYGISVGDRITVSGVTGDVIEIGLIRLYLMELSGTGIDLYPTGRVVVFSNSVMFQTAPFFKQLPGTAYAWHEIGVALLPSADHAAAEQKLLAAVTSVYSEYQHTIEHQHAYVERVLDTSITAPQPRAQLSFVDTGLELTVRYPVEIYRAAEIDEKVTRKLVETINNDAELKAAVVASPKMRAAIKA